MEVGELVRSAYAVDVTGCSLVRSLVNDVYVVTTPGERFALKIHRHGGRSVEEVVWEHDLMAHLIDAGVQVARPIALADGRPVGELTYPEGSRPFALSAWVEGRKPQPPFTDELYHAFGGSIAAFHAAADWFRSHRRRQHFDVERDLDEPLSEVLGQLAGMPADRDLVGELGAEARSHLVGFGERRELRPEDLETVPWLRVTHLIENLRFHLVLKPATRGAESISEGWVDRELDSLRDLGADLLSTD